MASHRSLRVAEAIREVVATAILFEVADPRIHAVTVVRVEVSADLRHATVHVSIMGSEAEQNRAMDGLNHAAGFLQARVAARLQTRFTPILRFKLDQGVKKSIELGRLIDQAVASDRRPDGGATDTQAAAGTQADPHLRPDWNSTRNHRHGDTE
jgi:ribosome-binding factor A